MANAIRLVVWRVVVSTVKEDMKRCRKDVEVGGQRESDRDTAGQRVYIPYSGLPEAQAQRASVSCVEKCGSVFPAERSEGNVYCVDHLARRLLI